MLHAGKCLFAVMICFCWSGAFAEETVIDTPVPVVQKSQTVGQPEVVEPVQKKPAAEPDFNKGPKPQWIWGTKPSGERDRFTFRHAVDGHTVSSWLMASCDNVLEISINGKQVASGSEWNSPVKVNIQKFLRPGINELTIAAENQGGPAGLVAKVIQINTKGVTTHLVTDESWQVAADPKSSDWKDAVALGPLGIQPWGNVFNNATSANVQKDVFNLLPGFQVELIYQVPKGTAGSWVCLTTDDKGRLIASDQGNKGLYRITPSPVGSDKPAKVEKLNVAMTSAQGMLHAFGSLYVSVNGGPGSGFYRLRDTNGDDQYDDVKKLRAFQGGGEHGPHAVRLSPDGKSLYVIAGNHTNPPNPLDSSRIPTNWKEDLLLPRQWDARGHARGKLAPGGWIAKTDPDGKTWELISMGYRNPYDMDFNADGELFAYDADMEWDMGTPWYRPTRVVHAVSGSEFGWRSGTGKWPTYYVDSLPQLVNIGPGSPVGVTFGYGTKFPAKYQKALYILDWTFGTMYAIHIKPDGASYTATKEEFVSRTPLPLTDATVGKDGALYFTIGGRGTQSALYRVTYVGDASTEPADATNTAGAELRAIRRKLEAFHGRVDENAAKTAWPYLSHSDRHIRYAARIAIEAQPIEQWAGEALTEKNPTALITALVGLARHGDASHQEGILTALNRLDFGELDETQQLSLLRLYGLTFVRLGAPKQRTADELGRRLDAYYPAKTNSLNRELVRLLAYLNSPQVIEKTLKEMNKPEVRSAEDIAELLARNPGYGGAIKQMLANQPELQKIHYAYALRSIKYGWTLEQRKEFFAWFQEASKKSGGASYKGFIENIRKEAVATLSESEKKALDAKVLAPPPKLTELPKPIGPGKEWQTNEVLSLMANGLRNRDFEKGKRAFTAARCAICHRVGGDGGATGPDLTNVVGRFSHKDLVEAITEPSKVISDQYRGSTVVTEDGVPVSGRILSEADGKLLIQTDPYDGTKVKEVPKGEVDRIVPSKVSLMPKDLLKPLNKEEVLDLMAYMLSRGNPNDRMFGP